MSRKRIVVTGAAGTLGRAVVARLLGDGHDVIGVDFVQAEDLPGLIGNIDLSDPDAAAALADRMARDGPIDGIATVAGGFVWEPIPQGSLTTWEWMFRMNVATAFNTIRAMLPHMKGGSAIVTVGAAASSKAGAGMGPYSASKSAISRMTEALAEELKERRIRVNAVLPSIIDTPKNRDEMSGDDFSRWVSPPELAAVISFLLSDDASAVTGASLPVTGRV